MADVSGLVIGAIALASLFSTCIELFDCFELGRNYAYDYQLACTKLGLLRARLSRWGLSLHIEAPGHELPSLRKHWPEERDVIGRSLLGIKTIFSDSSLLAQKYKLLPKRTRKPVTFALPLRSSTSPQIDSATTLPTASSSNWSFLRKRTLWAIHDKGKFDRLIQDLSFLIENLEKVTDRIHMPPMSERQHGDAVPDSGYNSPVSPNFDTDHSLENNTEAGGQLTVSTHPQDQRQLEHIGHLDTSQQGLQPRSSTMPQEVSLTKNKQTNSKTSKGVQGYIGDEANKTTVDECEQTNTDSAWGVQGVVSGKVAPAIEKESMARTQDQR